MENSKIINEFVKIAFKMKHLSVEANRFYDALDYLGSSMDMEVRQQLLQNSRAHLVKLEDELAACEVRLVELLPTVEDLHDEDIDAGTAHVYNSIAPGIAGNMAESLEPDESDSEDALGVELSGLDDADDGDLWDEEEPDTTAIDESENEPAVEPNDVPETENSTLLMNGEAFANALDQPSDGALQVATDEVTDVATDEATDEVTDQETDEVTDEVTNEATDEVTDEATDEASIKAPLNPGTESQGWGDFGSLEDSSEDVVGDLLHVESASDDMFDTTVQLTGLEKSKHQERHSGRNSMQPPANVDVQVEDSWGEGAASARTVDRDVDEGVDDAYSEALENELHALLDTAAARDSSAPQDSDEENTSAKNKPTLLGMGSPTDIEKEIAELQK